ncbi:DoxX family protein [Chryseobacterium gallinarum]|uniref:DoxX family protein n=1 Tax=Chryseobacterium gallinarum TaxID=1324352 RepID=A0A0G3M2D2_CHRGL|nr:DoxX family protein [Chryseobacterium gallinarum]AKK73341.1 DoxX family protein [Chryseobacterium gallinarum]
MTDKQNQFPQLFLRLALSVTILSAVADRFGWWSKENSSWGNMASFKEYTRQLTFFFPENLSTFSAYAATFLEILFPLMLIIGYKTKVAAYGTGFLLLIFAVSMTLASGLKAPLNYSVWVGSASAFLLAVQRHYSFSIDQINQK